MYIYNVTIKIDHARADEWLEYMKAKHLPDVMATGCFLSYRLSRLLDEGDLEGITFTIQYTCDDLNDFLKYKQIHAADLQREHSEKFGNDFVAFRTVMEVLEEKQ